MKPLLIRIRKLIYKLEEKKVFNNILVKENYVKDPREKN